jgi:hypothetical protein
MREYNAFAFHSPHWQCGSYTPYPNAIMLAFGYEVDYATLTKKYVGDSNLLDAAHRYSPGHVAGVERTVIRGLPDPEKISTSFCGAIQFVIADANAALHKAHKRFQQETGEPSGRCGVVGRVLQSLPRL